MHSNSRSTSSNSAGTTYAIATPGFIKNLVMFMFNVTVLEMNRFVAILQEYGIIKLLFR